MELVDRLQVLLPPPKVRPQPTEQIQPSGMLDSSLEFLVKRGFDQPLIEEWGILWNPDIPAVEIPAKDVEGKFVGYIWRMPQGEPKYRHPPGFPRAQFLFGLDRVSKEKEVILTEGPLDAIWVQAAGSPGVAVLGSYLTEGQVLILQQAGVRSVTLCFDNDPAGAVATELATKLLRSAGFWVFRIDLPQKHKDIQDVPRTKMSAVLAQKHLCLNGIGVIHHRYRRWIEHEAQASGVWRY